MIKVFVTLFKSLTRPKLMLLNCLTPSQASLSPPCKVAARSSEIFLIISYHLQPVFPVYLLSRQLQRKLMSHAEQVLLAAGVCWGCVIASTRATVQANTSLFNSSVMYYGKYCF